MTIYSMYVFFNPYISAHVSQYILLQNSFKGIHIYASKHIQIFFFRLY